MNKKILYYFFVIILLLLIFILIVLNLKNTEKKNNIIPVVQNVSKINITQQPQPEKLTNDSLLIQINKQHCLPENYIPSGLINISDYEILGSKNFLLRKIVMPDLKNMVSDAEKDGVELKVISAYRSYEDQKKIYNSWVKQLGLKEASRQSAPAGCSQHQLGTAVDFNELDFSFANSKAGLWLAKNSWKYGWVISYPVNSENITGYVYEPWHYRYIGKENALDLQKSGLILSKFLDIKNNF